MIDKLSPAQIALLIATVRDQLDSEAIYIDPADAAELKEIVSILEAGEQHAQITFVADYAPNDKVRSRSGNPNPWFGYIVSAKWSNQRRCFVYNVRNADPGAVFQHMTAVSEAEMEEWV